jgi:hypothetical protein
MPKVLYISFLRSEIATGNSSPFNQTRLGFAIFEPKPKELYSTTISSGNSRLSSDDITSALSPKKGGTKVICKPNLFTYLTFNPEK